MRISCLNEISRINEFFACDLVANPRTHAIASLVIADAGMGLEFALQISHGLNFFRKGFESGYPIGVKEVVFENGKLVGIFNFVIFTIFFLKKSVHLSGREFMAKTGIHLGEHSIVCRNECTIRAGVQHAHGDHFLRHGHRLIACCVRRQLNLPRLNLARKVKKATISDNELSD